MAMGLTFWSSFLNAVGIMGGQTISAVFCKTVLYSYHFVPTKSIHHFSACLNDRSHYGNHQKTFDAICSWLTRPRAVHEVTITGSLVNNPAHTGTELNRARSKKDCLCESTTRKIITRNSERKKNISLVLEFKLALPPHPAGKNAVGTTKARTCCKN